MKENIIRGLAILWVNNPDMRFIELVASYMNSLDDIEPIEYLFTCMTNKRKLSDLMKQVVNTALTLKGI